ncbi:MAG: YeeE/YedE family protein [Phycisphaerales bacterium]|jgi:uncharacterized protein|nr:YeeE/YedE family protein [Phycisphaerales bacterium]MBT7172006.1 YeeE/YedE family protein [Phycisphaerales bacterium]
MELLLGLITGIFFGFLLQKGGVLRFEKQVGFLLLRDATILKFMFSAILVGSVGIYVCRDMGWIDLKLKSISIGAQLIGGGLFGLGWAILGYCPGTAGGALGEGRWHAGWGILGMLVGAGLYAELYPSLKDSVLTWGTYGKKSIPEILGIHHWLIIGMFTLLYLAIFFLLERGPKKG